MSLQNDKINFLTREDVLLIHKSVLNDGEDDTVLNMLVKSKAKIITSMLESALYQPQATFDGKYLYENICEMAAAYLFSFARDHAFFTANKRVAHSTCSIFLQRNNHRLLLDNNEACDLTLKCAAGEYSKEDVIRIIGENIA